MPDLLTHVFVAHGCRKAAGDRTLTLWFLIGSVLPDLATRPFVITLQHPSVFWFVMPLHTPLGLFLLCVFISRFVARRKRLFVFLNLLAGSALHVILDFFQKHIGGGYYLFFPFTWESVEIGLFWPETSLYLLPVWLGLTILWAVRWIQGTSRSRAVERSLF